MTSMRELHAKIIEKLNDKEFRDSIVFTTGDSRNGMSVLELKIVRGNDP